VDRALSPKQIAEELVLSPHTVQDRMQDVFATVGVRSRQELVARLAA
jgi:DNA-binding NarL/FixJ family response regulator